MNWTVFHKVVPPLVATAAITWAGVPQPIGSEFQVNTYTTNAQYAAYSDAVAMSADGNFVVVWTSQGSGSTDDSSTSIQGQLFAAGGSRVGEEFQVNTFTQNAQGRPTAGMSADGEFVVAWDSYGSSGTDSDDFSIQAQLFAADGSRVGGQFQVNSYTGGPPVLPGGGSLVGRGVRGGVAELRVERER